LEAEREEGEKSRPSAILLKKNVWILSAPERKSKEKKKGERPLPPPDPYEEKGEVLRPTLREEKGKKKGVSYRLSRGATPHGQVQGKPLWQKGA